MPSSDSVVFWSVGVAPVGVAPVGVVPVGVVPVGVVPVVITHGVCRVGREGREGGGG